MPARTLILSTLAALALAFAAPAYAAPPTLLSVGSDRLHPTAQLAAPGADSVTVYISTSPDRATDGHFLNENSAGIDFLTDQEIASGVWMDEGTLDPGVYYVMLQAESYASCYPDEGEACPDVAEGYSAVLPLTILTPKLHFKARIKRGFLGEFILNVSPLGDDLPYKLCWNRSGRKRKCERATLDGYDWTGSASDTILLTADDLKLRSRQRRVKFTWYVGKKRVASKTVRIGS